MSAAFKTSYDVVVVGCGIHGAGVAQAVAARGLSVLVLEKSAIAAGTSSRSSKLIHGGLRYLENLQFKLVRECLAERDLLLRLAPGLVHLQPFYFPIYRHSRRRPWRLRLGLTLYALLGGLRKTSRFRRVPRRLWSTLDQLETRDLVAVYRYWDAQTDDAALTRAVMHSASRLGAHLQLEAELIHASLEDDGCVVQYRHAGRTMDVHCRVLINAAGPWANHVLARITPQQTPCAIDLVQGTHIMLPGRLRHGSYYLESPIDGRLVFITPWRDHALVGTTESDYAGHPDAVRPLDDEQEYLLRTAAHYFPQYRTSGKESILESFAGLRVLPGGSKTAFNRSRDTVLYADRPLQPRLVTIYGGKLTAYRATAARVISKIESSLPPSRQIIDTRNIPLATES